MSFNHNKLRGRIREICGTQRIFARKLGISDSALSLKLANKSEFGREEIHNSIQILEIEPQELNVYFFTLN